MRDRRDSDAGLRCAIRAKRITLAAMAALLLGSVDLHALVHQRQNLADAALAAEHPGPAHLDCARGAHRLPCLACAIGLRPQSRLATEARVLAPPADCGHLTVDESSVHAGRLPFRLPLSRAPPLS